MAEDGGTTALRILLIGNGQVATALGHALRNAGQRLIGMAGRDDERVHQVARSLSTAAFHLNAPLPKSDVVIIAVKDDAIAEVATGLDAGGALVVHTSGTSSMDLLSAHARRGVLWPVQTFISGSCPRLKDVPLVVETARREDRDLLDPLAASMGGRVLHMDHEQRQRLHLAAVLTSNFPVALINEACLMLERDGLPPDLLMPLWKTTAANVAAMGPERSLTGPARRGDQRTLDQHVKMLASRPELRTIYGLISDLILKRRKKDASRTDPDKDQP